MRVEPVPDAPAATAHLDGERALVIADYHAGIEAFLRIEAGVSLANGAEKRRERVRALLDATDPDRVVFLGDLAHFYGGPHGAERGEIEVLLEELTERVTVTIVKGNHDGGIEELAFDGVDVTPTRGITLGDVGFVHGHTWPSPAVLGAETVCIGHEHPCVRLTDVVGGARIEQVWVRSDLHPDPFEEYGLDVSAWGDPNLVVFPAFNDIVGGQWVNEPTNEYLAPFLPAALRDPEAYLLDGTRLGRIDALQSRGP